MNLSNKFEIRKYCYKEITHLDKKNYAVHQYVIKQNNTGSEFRQERAYIPTCW